MPYPRWLAKLNKHVFNPREVRRGERPVVVHAGRSTGHTYRTPVDAHPTRHGYVLVVRYGPDSDWVRNILAAGSANLVIGGVEHPLGEPRLVTQDEAIEQLADPSDAGGDFSRAGHYLLMGRRATPT